MRKQLDKLRHGSVLLFQATFGLAVLGAVLAVVFVAVKFVILVVTYFGFPAPLAKTIGNIAMFVFCVLVVNTWIVRKAAPPDRRILSIYLLWVLGPCFLGLVLFFAVTGNVYLGVRSSVSEILGFILVFVSTFMWAQISAPFARAWLHREAEDRNALFEVEKILSWPLTPKEQHDLDAHVSPGIYYSFLACILAIIFIVAETVLSEFLDDSFGSVSYYGAMVISLSIAAIAYPAHRRASKFVSIGHDSDTESVATDFQSAISEVGRALGTLPKLIIRYWYLALPLIAYLWYF